MADVKIESFCIAHGSNRDEIHQELAKVHAAGIYPQAECREGNVPGVPPGEYSVWSGPIERRP